MKQKGFTLIELLIVIAILGILVVMAYPHVAEPAANQELDKVTNELATDIRYMQQLSTNAGSDTPNRYQIQFNSTAPSIYVLINNSTIVKSGSINNTKFSASTSRIAITYDATSLNNNQATQIRITSLVTNKSKYIIIAPVTGRVRVSDSNATEPGEQ